MLLANLVGMINAAASLSAVPFKLWTTFAEFTWLSSLTVRWENEASPAEQRVFSEPSFQDDAG
jgi:hypothetical protein